MKVLSAGASGVDYRPALGDMGRLAEQHLAAHGLPGMSIGLSDAEGFRAVITVGLADRDAREAVTPDHLFQIGSISKSFAGVCTARLIEDGRLTLETSIASLLPHIRFPDGPAITLRHLLNHTSGLPTSAPVYSRAEGDRLWTGFPPGERFSYSNLGYNLLGMAMSRAAGLPYPEVVRKLVLRPLGIGRSVAALRSGDRTRFATGYAPLYRDRPYMRGAPIAIGPWFDLDEGAASMALTPGDMATYAAWLIGVGRGDGGGVFSDTTAGMFLNAAAPAPDRGDGALYAMGLTRLTEDGRCFLQHGGGMPCFSSSLLVDPETGVGAVASANVGRIGYRPRDIVAHACRLMRAARRGEPVPSPPVIDQPADNPQQYVGGFFGLGEQVLIISHGPEGLTGFLNGVTVKLVPDGDTLRIDHPWLGALPLTVALREGKMVCLWRGSTQFARDPADLDRRPVPADLLALEGRYDCDDPWEGVTRVFARPDGLYLDGTDKLTRLADGSWRPGEDAWSPSRIRFSAMVNGRAMRMSYSGIDFIRRDD